MEINKGSYHLSHLRLLPKRQQTSQQRFNSAHWRCEMVSFEISELKYSKVY